MSNETIIYSIQNGQDNEGCLMLELYNNNIGIINKVCNRLNVPEDLREDIKQEFFIWLSGAVNSFDFESDNKFSSYLFVYVRGQILRFMENQNICKIPSYKCQEINRFKREYSLLSQIVLREPTDKELSSFMSLPIAKILELKKDSLSIKATSLNEIVTEEGNEKQEFIPDEVNQIESLCDSLDVEYRNKELWNLVEEESKRKRKDIIEYYNGTYKGDKRTLQNDIYRTVKNLRKQPGKLKKLEVLSDFNCYRSKSVKAFQNDNFSIVEDLAILMYEREVFNKMNKTEIKTNPSLNNIEYKVSMNREAQEGTKNLGTCSICGRPAEKRMLSRTATFNYLTKGIKPQSRNFENVCEACMLRERRDNKIAFELNEEGELIEYR